MLGRPMPSLRLLISLLLKMREVALSGVVGVDFDAESVSDDLSFLSGPIRIRLNSGGGIAFDGSAIHSVLSAYQGHKTIVVQGIAASAASVIMMAAQS